MTMKLIIQHKCLSTLIAYPPLRALFLSGCSRGQPAGCIHIAKSVYSDQSAQTYSTQRSCHKGDTVQRFKYPVQNQEVLSSNQFAKSEVLISKENGGFYTLHRRYCTKQQNTDPVTSEVQNQTDTLNFIPIYKFPYIVHARIVSRLKIYHTAFTTLLVPVVLYLNHAGMVPVLAVYTSLGFFAVAGVMLGVISSFLRRIVGRLYIDEKKEIIKLAHLTFWSHRKDEFYKISDIVPLSQTSENPSDIFIKLRMQQGPTYYISLKYGGVLDKDEFWHVLG